MKWMSLWGILLFFSCADTEEASEKEQAEDLWNKQGAEGFWEKECKQKINLPLEEVSFIEAGVLFQPENIAIQDSLLVVYEPETDTLLRVFDIKNERKAGCFFPKGQASDEAVSLQTICFDGAAPFFYCSDERSRINTFSLPSFRLVAQKSYKEGPRIVTFARDKEQWFFSVSGVDQPFMWQRKGMKPQAFGAAFSLPGMAPAMVTSVLKGTIIVAPQAVRRLAWLAIWGDALQIYDYTNEQAITLIKSEAPQPPVVASGGALEAATKIGVVSVAADEKYIYALYSNRSLKDALKLRKDALFCQKIVVFDWSGMPRSVLNTGKWLRAVAYHAPTRSLYALGLDDKGDYRVFRMPYIAEQIR